VNAIWFSIHSWPIYTYGTDVTQLNCWFELSLVGVVGVNWPLFYLNFIKLTRTPDSGLTNTYSTIADGR